MGALTLEVVRAKKYLLDCLAFVVEKVVMSTQHPFYYTWTSQEQGQAEAALFRCEEMDDFHFLLAGGERVLDMASISCQACFGHRPQFIYRALEGQWRDAAMHSPKADFSLKRSVSRKICDLVGSEGKIFYCVSGAEAVEHGVKMVRMMTGKKVVAARKKSYHGATLGAASLTGDWRGELPPTVDEWTLRLPEPAEDPQGKMARQVILERGPENVAAVCLETITAVNGVVIPPDSWYRSIQNICDEFGIKLILDEVASGLYRTGKAFAYHHYPHLRPDVVCMAKALTGGVFPLGAVWTNRSVADYFQKRVLCTGLTYYAHPLGLAAADAVLDRLVEPPFERERVQLEDVFAQELEATGRLPEVDAIRWKGLMAAVDWKGKAGWIDFVPHGLYLMAREGQLFLAPAYNMKPQLLRRGMERLRKALGELAR